jgi:hypothetical protein
VPEIALRKIMVDQLLQPTLATAACQNSSLAVADSPQRQPRDTQDFRSRSWLNPKILTVVAVAKNRPADVGADGRQKRDDDNHCAVGADLGA